MPETFMHPYRGAYIVAITFLVALAVLSVVFYKERMLFVDPCWIIFNIINTGTFCIAEHRYGAFITQMCPVIGVHLGWSLRTILIIYSASFYVFYLAAAIITGYVWRQHWLSILLVIYLTLFVSDVYYWPNNEVHQGVAWMVLFLGYYIHTARHGRKNIIKHAVLFLLAFLAIFSHLIVLLPFTFLWLYYHTTQHNKLELLLKNRLFIWYSSLIAALIGARYLLSSSGWYDSIKLQRIHDISLPIIIQSFSSGQSQSFLQLLLHNYWIALPFFLLGLLYLLKNKCSFQIALLIIYTATYYMLICITYPDAFGRSLRFYMESEWMALSIIMMTPFVIDMIPAFRQKSLIPSLFILIFSIRILYILESFSYFNNRYTALEKITVQLQAQDIKKALIVQDKATADSIFIMDWGLPAESMMLSVIKGFEPPVTFKVITPDFIITQPRDSFYSCFDLQAISRLNSKYFQPDTTQPYLIIPISTVNSE
ncbi:MAG TPA: hypothetical protein PKC76_06775 [Saprospiraceae bacterium]|nr:hypothetical protein [Saprospiraceae bacterium]HMP23816.1 hypothetical protein [Saprospiraceae bacterium]